MFVLLLDGKPSRIQGRYLGSFFTEAVGQVQSPTSQYAPLAINMQSSLYSLTIRRAAPTVIIGVRPCAMVDTPLDTAFTDPAIEIPKLSEVLSVPVVMSHS